MSSDYTSRRRRQLCFCDEGMLNGGEDEIPILRASIRKISEDFYCGRRDILLGFCDGRGVEQIQP